MRGIAPSVEHPEPNVPRWPRRWSGRTGAILLTLAVEALFVAMLLGLGAFTPADRRVPVLVTMTVRPLAAAPPARTPAVSKPTPRRPAAPAAPRIAPPPPIVPPVGKPGYVVLSRADYVAGDIGRLRRTETADAGSIEGAAGQAGDSKVAGTGPGGETLYGAEWVREPTDAELAQYMPPRVARPAWALIMCQTVERSGVDNCRMLGETPGSGLARAMRLASWQFKVRPPRVGGKPLVGSWVRIRFDFSTAETG